MLDVGTANALSLRRNNSKVSAPVTAPAPVSAAPASPATSSQVAPAAPTQAQVAAQQTPTVPGQAFQTMTQPAPKPTQQNQAAAVAAPGLFQFDPPTLTQPKGSTFTVNVVLSGGQNVYSVPVQLSYDPSQLQVVTVSNGGFLSQDGQVVALVHRDDPLTGTLQVTATRPPGAGGVSGQGAVMVLTFMAKGPGQSALTITRGGARDPAMQPIAMSGAQAAITIQ